MNTFSTTVIQRIGSSSGARIPHIGVCNSSRPLLSSRAGWMVQIQSGQGSIAIWRGLEATRHKRARLAQWVQGQRTGQDCRTCWSITQHMSQCYRCSRAKNETCRLRPIDDTTIVHEDISCRRYISNISGYIVNVSIYRLPGFTIHL